MDVTGGLVIVLAAIALGSFVKGVTGMGLPMVAIPVMAMFVGVERAVVVMAIPGVVSNALLMWRCRGYARDTRDLPALIAFGVAGSLLGTFGLDRLDASVLALVLAGAVVGYVVLNIGRVGLDLRAGVTRFTSPPVGFGAGLLQGATGISGPVVSAYLHGYRLPRQAYVFSIVTLFQVYAVAQVAMIAHLGLYTTSRVVESVASLVPMMLFMPLGSRLADRLDARSFDVWLMVVITASALRLAYDGAVGLFG